MEAGIQDIPHILEELGRSSPDERCTSDCEVHRLDLLGHDEPGQVAPRWDRQVKREISVGIRDRADDRKSCASIEFGVANDERRSTTSLLVTRLRIKGQEDKVSFGGDVPLYQTS